MLRKPASSDASGESSAHVTARRVWRATRGGGRTLSRPAVWLGRRTAPLLAAVLWVLRWPVRLATRAWRRSLQVRVVSMTLVMSVLVVLAFGVLLAWQITDGLVNAKREAAIEQVKTGRGDAQQQLGALSGPNDPDLPRVARSLVSRLGTVPGRAGTFEVVLVPTGDDISIGPYGYPHEAQRYVPAGLRERVTVRGVTATQFATANPDDDGMRPYLAVGTPVRVSWGQFELYYLFPLDDEVEAADLVRTAIVVTGIALVALLAMVAAVITRLVTTPVRLAAQTAQRLAAGLLHERMAVRGEDDLARLGASFNQMAANLQQQIAQLEELSRLQRRFTSDVSHELRTPLTTVRMAADVLHNSREDFPPVAARSAELLQAELDRFESLLTDLLEISRFDAGFAVLDAEPTDLVPLVDTTVATLAPLAERLGVPVSVGAPAEPVIAEVDARRVERIVRNLIGNAIEHGEGQPVEITLAAADGAVAVAVRDHGIGLRPGEEKLVFNRFWRADPSRARQTGGTGLGLSISLEDARLHGGWLEAWGAPNAGAQFRLTLPAHAGERLVASPLDLVPEQEQLAATALDDPAGPAPAGEAAEDTGTGDEAGDRPAPGSTVPGGHGG